MCVGRRCTGYMGAAECSDILARRLTSNSIRTCQLASFTNSIKYYSFTNLDENSSNIKCREIHHSV